jgi:hypothetical protein
MTPPQDGALHGKSNMHIAVEGALLAQMALHSILRILSHPVKRDYLQRKEFVMSDFLVRENSRDRSRSSERHSLLAHAREMITRCHRSGVLVWP